MRRARWFTATWPVTLRTLATRLRTRAFTNDTTDGFLLDRTREDYIEGRYIEKLTFQETIPDPFGFEVTYDRTTFRQIQFTMYRDYPQLELRDAPRGTQAFISRLLEITDFSMSTTPLTVDVMQWAENLANELGTSMIMDTVHLGNLAVAPKVTGSMIVKSDADVRPSLHAITNGRTYSVEKIRVTWRGPHSVSLVLTNSGAVTMDEADAEILAAVRAAMPSV